LAEKGEKNEEIVVRVVEVVEDGQDFLDHSRLAGGQGYRGREGVIPGKEVTW